MKADLAIYSLVVGMSGLWVNVATMLNNKLDFYCCDNSVGFCKSGHIFCFILLIVLCKFLRNVRIMMQNLQIGLSSFWIEIQMLHSYLKKLLAIISQNILKHTFKPRIVHHPVPGYGQLIKLNSVFLS